MDRILWNLAAMISLIIGNITNTNANANTNANTNTSDEAERWVKNVKLLFPTYQDLEYRIYRILQDLTYDRSLQDPLKVIYGCPDANMTMTVYADSNTNINTGTTNIDADDRIFNPKPNMPLRQYLQHSSC